MRTHDVRPEPRHHDVYRQAYLLTGDPGRAVRLADEALARISAGSPTATAERAKTALVRAVVADPGRPAGADHPDLPGWQALCRLPARRRASMVLRFDERLTEEEAAARLGSSPQTVRADVDAALLTLRTAMAGEDDDPWMLVSTGLSTAGRRWSAALGAPEPARPDGPPPTPSATLRGPVPIPRLGTVRPPDATADGPPAEEAPGTAPPQVRAAAPIAPALSPPRRWSWPVAPAAAVAALLLLVVAVLLAL